MHVKLLLTFLISIFTMTALGLLVSEKEFATRLHEKKICSDHNYQKLLTAIDRGELTENTDYLKFCDKAVVIDLTKYNENPDDYLLAIHENVAKLIPELSFTDFKFQIVVDSSLLIDDSRFYRFAISLHSNGKTYRQQSFYRLYSISENKYYGSRIDAQGFYKIFNKILADLQSPYRLHMVKSMTQNAGNHDIFGIIALTRHQFELFKSGVLFSPSLESYKNSITSESIDTAIAAYQKIELFSNLSAEQIKTAIQKAAEQENGNLNDVLRCFPHVIYTFDTELGNLEYPYAEILREMSLLSKGAFRPENITDAFMHPLNKKCLLKFSMNGKEYTRQLEVIDDWIDPSFLQLVDQALRDNHVNGKFYDLYSAGQEASIAYLTEEQASYLRQNHLLVFADQWKQEEE